MNNVLSMISDKKKPKNLTKEDIVLLNSIEFEFSESKKLMHYIKRYDELCISYYILFDNWNEIKQLNGRDSSSLLSNQIRYGQVVGKRLFDKKTAKTTMTRGRLIERFGEDYTNDMLSSRGASLDNYITRWGEEIGIEKWDNYLAKRLETFSANAGTYQSRDLSWYQNKHGNEKGYEVWDNKRKSQAYKVSTAYYVEKYGEEEGRARIKIAKARGLPFYIKKYGEIIGKEKYEISIKKRTKHKFPGYSKLSMEICHAISKSIPDLYYYGDNELILTVDEDTRESMGFGHSRFIKPDIFYNGKIIEINGDVFHANPDLFIESDQPHPFNQLTAGQMWEKDKRRMDYFAFKGYESIVVWENKYRLDTEGIIQECIKFLKT
jgi:hypothetical protein